MTTTTIVDNVTCLGCGCTCDDIAVAVRDGRIVEARNACSLGVRWFGDGQVPARSTIEGRDAPLPQAVLVIAGTLAESARPLVLLAPGLSCDAQREAVALADTLGARLDSATSATAAPFILAGQEHGSATATLGEIRNRATVLVFWAVDLASRYPRFASRYAPEPAGAHVPDGRQSRTVIAVDVGAARANVDADRRITIDPSAELSTLTALEAFARAPANASTADDFGSAAPWLTACELAPVLFAARYAAIVYDAEPDERAVRSAQRFGALASLAQALNERTRAAGIGLRAGGNRSGADAVLTSQTGYPFAIDFSFGMPRYDPHGRSALALLDGGDVDVALVVGDAAGLPANLAARLGAVRTVLIGPRASDVSLGSAVVAIDTGVDGIHSPGTAYRTDDVPLPLRESVPGPPPAAGIVRAVSAAIMVARS
jgi:formylmethanofuran dehydrogenase subunit B